MFFLLFQEEKGQGSGFGTLSLKKTEQTYTLCWPNLQALPPLPPPAASSLSPCHFHPWTRPEGEDISEDPDLSGEKRQGKGMACRIPQVSQAFDFTTASEHCTGTP